MDKRKNNKGRRQGEGAVQIFFNSLGDGYIAKLYSECQSADMIAELMIKKHNFYCCGNTIRKYLLDRREWNHIKTGGDHRSKKVFKAKKEWIKLKLKELKDVKNDR